MSPRSRNRRGALSARASSARTRPAPAGVTLDGFPGRERARLPSGPPNRLQESWSRVEVALFKAIHGTHTDEELARFFGRSLENVHTLARELRLAKDKAWLKQLHGPRATRMPRWKRSEIRLLKEQYATRANLELARELSRSVASVVSKARLLGLKKSARRLRDMGRENVSVRYSP